MKVTKLTNTSEESVTVRLVDGGSVSLPPQGRVENVDVSNLNEIRPKVKAVEHIQEVLPEGVNQEGKRQYLKG